DVEAEPEPTLPGRSPAASLLVLAEYAREVLFGKSGTTIPHEKRDFAAIGGLDVHVHGGRFWRISDGVLQKIHDDALHLVPVPPNLREIARRVHVERGAARVRQGTQRERRVARDLEQIHFAAWRLELGIFRPAHFQEIVHQHSELIAGEEYRSKRSCMS